MEWGVASPETMEWLRNYSFDFAQKINDSTVEGLRALMLNYNQEGWSVVKLMDELQGMYNGWDRTQAEMIARSETLRASNEGALAAFKSSGYRMKQWYTELDGRTCPHCASMHLKIVGVDENYWNKGDVMSVVGPDGQVSNLALNYSDVRSGELHPNCRCTILPVVE